MKNKRELLDVMARTVFVSATVGFVIEEQAHSGAEYAEGNPYDADHIGAAVDSRRYPLAAGMVTELFAAEPEVRPRAACHPRRNRVSAIY
ncbi:hypothetical protein OHB12_07355 [Nocardia sp. NBC_01730]|uniref:hypothetical protein n=1 Tax=Nocardia sp. NBC_01730 TaxID=2975998 RepID=UPI002E14D95A|nr:hypothetical protein OHB12_07355 [Nocardia sp. NBC_01730]